MGQKAATICLICTLFSATVMSAGAQTTLYSENFSSYPNGSNPSSWSHGGSWEIESSSYGNFASTNGCCSWTDAVYDGASFSDFNYSATVESLSNCKQQPPVLALIFRSHDTKGLNTYGVWIDISVFTLFKMSGGKWTSLASTGNGIPSADLPSFEGSFYVMANASSLIGVFHNQYNHKTYTVSAGDVSYSSGYIGLATYNCRAAFTNLVVLPVVSGVEHLKSVVATPGSVAPGGTLSITGYLVNAKNIGIPGVKVGLKAMSSITDATGKFTFTYLVPATTKLGLLYLALGATDGSITLGTSVTFTVT